MRESEEKYRRIVETAHEGIWVVDAGAVTTFVNPRLQELLGYAPREMIEHTVITSYSIHYTKLYESCSMTLR